METARYKLEKQQISYSENDFSHKSQNEDINSLFNKRFAITKNEYYSLPEPTTMFKDCPWTLSELQMLKSNLNNAKNCLNNYDLDQWHLHTSLMNSARDVIARLKRDIQPELLTQAWCKFYEIVSSFPLIPLDHIHDRGKCFKSIHLCEAPGAFVTSLNHWLKTNASDIQWNWIAMTLNPYYEGNSAYTIIDDDRFIRHTLDNWYFGDDGTGNLMNTRNVDELIKLSEPHYDILLVTADGSIDCTDVPAEQENVLIHLHFCETIAALQLLAAGGSFLLKIFTIFECNTVCLIYLLSCCFDHVNVVKPATSKEGNSETYIVCINFKGSAFAVPYLEKLKAYYECGPKQAIFSKHDIPYAFIDQIIECNKLFNYQQCQVMQRNMDTFNNINLKMSNIKQFQRMVADKYIRDFNLKQLVLGEIVGNATLSRKNISTTQRKKSLQGSYNERCKRQCLTPLKQIQSFYESLAKIEMHVSAGETRKYQFTKLPKNLQIRMGNVFDKICNSKFCNKNILKIQNGVDDILIKINHRIPFPSTIDVDKILADMPNCKVLSFRYTDVYDTHKLILKICDTLQDLQNGTTLILFGYSLLTHFNIALLYLISCAFNLLKVTVCDDVGLKITLHQYDCNITVLQFLNEIKTASSKAQEEGKAIYQIISPLILYEGCDLCYSTDFNHWVIKTYVNHVLCNLQ